MKQICIVAPDRVGLIADISYILGKAKINIDAISVDVYGGKGVINITVKDEKKAARLLKMNNYEVLESELLIIKVRDEPGGLSEVSKLMKDSGVNIESIYLITRGEGFSLDALKVDKPKKAKKLLAPYIVKGD